MLNNKMTLVVSRGPLINQSSEFHSENIVISKSDYQIWLINILTSFVDMLLINNNCFLKKARHNMPVMSDIFSVGFDKH